MNEKKLAYHLKGVNAVFLIFFNAIYSNLERNPIDKNENVENTDELNLKNSGFWTLSPFVIDDTGGGDYTWTEAVAEEWCNV